MFPPSNISLFFNQKTEVILFILNMTSFRTEKKNKTKSNRMTNITHQRKFKAKAIRYI